MTYGYCPICGDHGVARQRRPNGDDTCVNNHTYPSKTALPMQPLTTRPQATQTEWMAGLSESYPELFAGPLAIAVSSQHEADALREMLNGAKGPADQGIMVIPFGGSVLSFSPGGTALLRGYVSIPPNGGPITRQAFEAWIEKAIAPYLAPNASRLVL
ncbi:hypothetical protein CcrColossus_gp064 [Caulobacter phage CcrColossus]|uniref:Uncharacterized protein n=1 Tax=Caulobacter phage CcrColossus TaxID=1211640 RepID=K4JRJ9_9CAUD|nr:hypothetical protein CcrColossus_gp064 [Caulobacter phage CcrColossus]AFU87934.1 hypothetical protein CcrColossus_gp064 [Caulobacter phage CcrColossus]